MYTYVHNNPLKFTDPSGHDIFDVYIYQQTGYHRYKSDVDYYFENWKDIATYNFLGGEEVLTLIYSKDPKKVAQAVNDLAISFVPMGSTGKLGAKIGKWADDTGEVTKVIRKAMGCNCFTAGTKVLTDEGEKPIEEIEVGDKVLAKSDETGEVAYKEVVGLFQKQADEIYYVHIGDEIIEVTGEHPFWLDGKGWTFVKDLKVGDLLVSSDGSKLAIDKIEKEPREATVYNFMVSEYQSYFVSNLGIWVHNCFVSPALAISDKKAGQKLVQHLRDDWGLDPSVAANRDWMKNYVTDIHANYNEVRQGTWRTVTGGQSGSAFFYRKENDVVVTDLEGNFITILKDGATQNTRFKEGTVLDAR
ncbi:polymorphic toxin-type HINT domain-containing protein [Paenibacillus elgii]